MFEGYEDPVLQMYSSLESDEEEEQDAFWMEGEESTPAPPKIPMDRFGWFYKVGAFRKMRAGWWFCRGTGQHGPTGICGCTRGRATWSVWVKSSPGTRTTKLRHFKASRRETHVGREIINEPWSIGNFSSSRQRDGSPNWQPVFFPFCCSLDLTWKKLHNRNHRS